MQRFNIPKDEQNYWMAFYLRGIWAVIQEWIDGDCNEPVEKIESIIEKCVFNEKVLHE
ncbi:MAG: TetR-like C-terminal domain-containing protein [Lachnospiraceae bacterium]